MIHTPPVDRFCARLSRFSSELSASAPVAAGFSSFANWQASRVAGLRRSAGRLSSRTEQGRRLLRTRHTRVVPTFTGWKIPESGIPPSDRATRRYTKVHLDVCLRFSMLIGQIGLVPLFGAGPRRYFRSRLFRLAVTVFWRAHTASWWKKGK